ncbi:MAG: GreA/GreB family elongation factor [Bacilli bacterium]|nr:GreA/GreB family elongation factor [Bacilli bacterium]
MAGLVVFLIVIAIIIVSCSSHISYEGKVNDVKGYFTSQLSKYNDLLNLKFKVRTDGKKIKTWNKQHKIDYIINNNKDEIIRTLKLYNEFRIWWSANRENIINATTNESNRIADNMILFSNSFRKRIDNEVEELIDKFNPEQMYYELKTYSIQSNTQRYNANTKEWYEDSPNKTTFYKELSPEEVLFRIEVLAKYNFEMTEYQYNCENQRSLMTPELRQEIILRDSSTCQICGKKCQPYDIEIDHIQPISKGGKTTKSNLQVLCVSCNRSKSNKWLDTLSSKTNHNQTKIAEQDINKSWENFNKKYNEAGATVGDVVEIEYLDTNNRMCLKLVNEMTDNFQGCVSIYSPIGEAIYGHKEGEVIDFKTPNGVISIKIIKINK